MLLAAVDCVLGTCWVVAFDEGHCREVLSIAENLRPVAMITIGHAAGKIPRRGRRPLEEIVIWDQ